MSQTLHDWGPDSADRSLHTAGPSNPDRDSRLGLLGPAAIGSGPGRRRVTRTNPGWSGQKAVATASRTGTGRDDQDAPLWGSGAIHCHAPCYRWDSATTQYKGSVAGVQESALMEVPTRVTTNTSATPMCPGVDEIALRMMSYTIPRAPGWAGRGRGRDPHTRPTRALGRVRQPSPSHSESWPPFGLGEWSGCSMRPRRGEPNALGARSAIKRTGAKCKLCRVPHCGGPERCDTRDTLGYKRRSATAYFYALDRMALTWSTRLSTSTVQARREVSGWCRVLMFSKTSRLARGAICCRREYT
jgi:hypothetical protein